VVNVKEVPAEPFIKELARYLKENFNQVRPPEWAYLVKTGSHKEKVPEDTDWWYIRAASIMRKIYVAGRPVGIERLRTAFGGLKDRGSAPSHFRKAGGSHIRTILQQLERAGLVTKEGNKGRIISPKGLSVMSRVANKVFNELVNELPSLAKYGGGSKK
jgi:small subunit ribosomal protein S19e